MEIRSLRELGQVSRFPSHDPDQFFLVVNHDGTIHYSSGPKTREQALQFLQFLKEGYEANRQIQAKAVKADEDLLAAHASSPAPALKCSGE